jgi:hypothetical protein
MKVFVKINKMERVSYRDSSKVLSRGVLKSVLLRGDLQ